MLRQFAALWAMVTMGTAPINVLHYYFIIITAETSPEVLVVSSTNSYQAISFTAWWILGFITFFYSFKHAGNIILGRACFSSVQFSSVQFKMVSMRSGRPSRNESHGYFLLFWDFCSIVCSTAVSLKWCKRYHTRSTGFWNYDNVKSLTPKSFILRNRPIKCLSYTHYWRVACFKHLLVTLIKVLCVPPRWPCG